MKEKWRCRLSGDSEGKWQEIQAESPGSAAMFYAELLSKSHGHGNRLVDVLDEKGRLTQCCADPVVTYRAHAIG